MKIIRRRVNSTGSSNVVKTLIPGAQEIELVAYYEEFASYYPDCELQTKRFFLENVQPDWVCIDAGANIGYHAILLGRLASQGQVYAFEPTSTFDLLQRNLDWNQASNVTAIRMGLTSQSFEGTLPLYRIWGQDPEPTQATYTTVDDFVSENGIQRVDLLKIDVDGYDLEVLWGAKQTLERFSPIVVIELDHALSTRGYTPSQAMDFMLARRYSSALVLDQDNYAFKNTWDLGQPWPDSLSISFDHRDPRKLNRLVAGTEIYSTITSSPRTHNGTTVNGDQFAVLDAPPWNYALSYELPRALPTPSAVCAQVEVRRGVLGVFVSDEGGSNLMTNEVETPADQSTLLVLPVESSEARQLVMRKITSEPLEFIVGEIQVRSLEHEPNAVGLMNSVSAEVLEATLHEAASENWSRLPLAQITAADTRSLAIRLSIEPDPVRAWRHRSEDGTSFLMERDDAPVLEWLFRSLRPNRHFEFGTWEGFGTTLCLRSCNASVWTINLQHGEIQDGSSTYPLSRYPWHPQNPRRVYSDSSDSGDSIGWIYRAVGFSDRVTQLLCNSTEFSVDQSLEGKFDTVLIDGAHDRRTVRLDQRNALKLLNDHGVIIWHDFSLDADVIQDLPSCRGVVAAVSDDVPFLRNHLDLYWIRDSLLLVGVRRHNSAEASPGPLQYGSTNLLE